MAGANFMFFIPFLLLSSILHSADAQIGVAYGNSGDNLPSPQDVVNLYQSNGIGSMRLYYPDQATLQALQGTNIQVALGIHNDDVPSLASDQSNVQNWVNTNILPFQSSIKYIVVGNEIDPNNNQASSVLPLMQSVLNELNSNQLGDRVKITTSIGTSQVINAFPPSSGQFSNPEYITPIVKFLNDNNSPLFVNIYPYFAYKNNPQQISLDYALFTSPTTVTTDPNTGKGYQNLFDALADATYSALDKVGGPNIRLVTSETGWSSGGGVLGATLDNAKTYYTNYVRHVKGGTPLKPDRSIESFLFTIFDEDQKPGAEDERHFGLFTPDKQPKYGPLDFS